MRKNITKITTSYSSRAPDPWCGMVFTIKRVQIRTYISYMAKIGVCCMSRMSETSKYRRTLPLGVLIRHIPIALGASRARALGVGCDTPRSIKIGHAPVGTALRPPRRHFMRKHVVMWAKFRLLSRNAGWMRYLWNEGWAKRWCW